MPDAVAPGWTELGPCGPRAPAAQQRPVRFTQDALEKVSPFYGGCFWFLRGGGRRTIQTSSNITTTPFSSSSPVVDLAWLARGAFIEKKMSYFPDGFSSLYIFFCIFLFFGGVGLRLRPSCCGQGQNTTKRTVRVRSKHWSRCCSLTHVQCTKGGARVQGKGSRSTFGQ